MRQTAGPNPYAFGTSEMPPASASRAGVTPEASRDRSSGTGSRMNIAQVNRGRLFIGSVFSTWICLLLVAGCRMLAHDVDLITPYDGMLEAPCPPEVIASLVDQTIDSYTSNVTLRLVHHPQPYSQPVGRRAAWVCMVEGKPLWVIAAAPR